MQKTTIWSYEIGHLLHSLFPGAVSLRWRVSFPRSQSPASSGCSRRLACHRRIHQTISIRCHPQQTFTGSIHIYIPLYIILIFVINKLNVVNIYYFINCRMELKWFWDQFKGESIWGLTILQELWFLAGFLQLLTGSLCSGYIYIYIWSS